MQMAPVRQAVRIRLFRTRFKGVGPGFVEAGILAEQSPDRGDRFALIAGLQGEPELWRCAEIAAQTKGRVGRGGSPAKHEVVQSRAGTFSALASL